MADLAACRTEALGGQMYRCDRCGHAHPTYHSCRNRSCPKCHRTDTRRWLRHREQELLPVGHFHLIFTLPPALHRIVRSHQRILHAVLMNAAAHALMTLARDPKFLGARIGILAVLHTWGGALNHHPHVHFLVPAGGLSPDGSRWIPSRKHYLVPVQALSILFRARFMALARKALPQLRFPQSLWQTPWVVHCKPAIQGPHRVIQYLARYVHRIAITNRRILSTDERTVTFRYKDSRHQRWKTMTLDAQEFLRRFLQHVLPRGAHKVRYYGLLSPYHHHLLPRPPPPSPLSLLQNRQALLARTPLAPPEGAPMTIALTCPRRSSGPPHHKTPFPTGRFPHGHVSARPAVGFLGTLLAPIPSSRLRLASLLMTGTLLIIFSKHPMILPTAATLP